MKSSLLSATAAALIFTLPLAQTAFAQDLQEWQIDSITLAGKSHLCGGTLVSARLAILDRTCTEVRMGDAQTGEVRFARGGGATGRLVLSKGDVAVFILNRPVPTPVALVPDYRADMALLKHSRDPLASYVPATRASGINSWRKVEPGGTTGSRVGDGVFATNGQGTKWLVGTLKPDGKWHRLSDSWPQLIQALVDDGEMVEAVQLSKKVLNPFDLFAQTSRPLPQDARRAYSMPETLDWGAFDRKGTVGTIFPSRDSTGKPVFFRLIGLDAEQRYESFPTDQKDNRSWEYLGQRLPSRGETLAEVENWRPEGKGARIGDSYVAFNAHSGEVEYFRLEKLDAAGRYGPLPTHRTNDDFWTYIGTDMPGQQVKTWGSSDRRGTLGEVYIYDNPYTRKVEYFKLKALGADGRYWYFPIDGKDNVWWTYLGTDLPTPTSRFNLIY